MKTRPFALLSAVLLIGLEATLITGCATTTTRNKSSKETMAYKDTDGRGSKPKNFTLHRDSDIDWKFIRRGQKTMGAPALESY